MLANKWIQAVLCGGIGLGMIVGALATAVSGLPITVGFVGWIFLLISMWKTANVRGTDGWGGPYHGPK